MKSLLTTIRFIIALFLVGMTEISHAETFDFLDSFDDPDFTNSLWLDGNPSAPQTWAFVSLNGSDLGWHATVDSLYTWEPAFKVVNNGREYYNAGLYLEVFVRMDTHSGLYSTPNEKIILALSAGDNGNYFVEIEQKFDGNAWRGSLSFGTHNSHNEITLVEVPIVMEFNTFYKLIVQVDMDENIEGFLYDLNSTLLGSISSPKVLGYDKGAIGIGGRYSMTFNDFYVSGTPVPIIGTPAMPWLMLLLGD